MEEYTCHKDEELGLNTKDLKSILCIKCSAYIGEQTETWYIFTGIDELGNHITAPICDDCFGEIPEVIKSEE